MLKKKKSKTKSEMETEPNDDKRNQADSVGSAWEIHTYWANTQNVMAHVTVSVYTEFVLHS